MSYAKPAVLIMLALVASCGSIAGRVTDSSLATYVRTDTDRTTVLSPRVSVAGEVEERVKLEAAYAMDAWTGASIDVRTAATQAIHEERHELSAGAGYELQDLAFSAGYRYSTEEDYDSHGGVLGAELDLAQKDTQLAAPLFGSVDNVGRAGDPSFDEQQTSQGLRATFTQVLSRDDVLQLSWETTRIGGFQAGVYRFVALGGDGTCASEAPYCIPERAPDERYRQAGSVRGRHALSDRVSLGLDYRLYLDSWGVASHTIEPSFALRLGEGSTLSLYYRYYTQGEADFYRPRYVDAAGVDGFATRDRKLSAFYSHAAGASLMHEAPIEGTRTVLMLGARSSLTQLEYLAFIGLSEVTAFELTTTAALSFR